MAKKKLRGLTGVAASVLLICSGQVFAQAASEEHQWQHYPQRPEAPKGAPNVLLIMTDDVGFGAASGFGGLIDTPTFDAVGQQGVRFNRFHTTAMCSPTRAALLTGRNHHAVNSGAIANLSRDVDGYTSAIPDNADTIADVLRANGYVTAFLGKNHNTPEWESGSMGPFDRWPTGMGFDYFYGFNAAWADQYAPELVENTTQIEPPKDPNYLFDKDLADHAVEWLRRRENGTPNSPFFLYVAPGSPHTPHHAPADWIARYRGKFDMGWDKAREAIFKRQKAAGIIPATAVLTPRPKELPAWDSLSPDDKKVAARMMEVYAAQLSYVDYQIGRILDELRRSGQLDNTLVIYLQGDNGGDMASYNGEDNEWGAFFGEEPEYRDILPNIDKLGSHRAFGGYPAPWAWAMDTPFQWGKALAGYLGGIRSGMAMSWGKGIGQKGRIDDRFAHVTDIAPTIYQAAGITPPDTFDGVKQLPLDGVSLVGEFSGESSKPTHRSQYFEMLGNLGYYEDDWFIGTKVTRPPWDRTSPKTPIPSQIADFPWELYNLARDYSQSKNVAAQNPAKLREMIAGFTNAAEKNHVFPVENDVMVLLNPNLRPHALGDLPEYTYSRSGTRYVAADIPPLRGRWKITAQVSSDSAAPSGPIFVQGGRFSGWGLLLREGKLTFVSRPSFDKAKYADVSSSVLLTPGKHMVSVEIIPDPSAGRFAARAELSIDGQSAGAGSVPDSRIVANPAYLGRYGLTPLLDDPAIPATCQCEVGEVRLTPRISASVNGKIGQ